MNLRNKATRIRLADFSSAPMRAFHMSWLAFFLCFFGWFGIAPLMPVIRQELHLTKAQIGNLDHRFGRDHRAGAPADRLAVRPHRSAPGVHLAADSGLAAGDGSRPGARLHHVSDLPAGDRRDRRVVRHHAVSHVGDVRAEHRGNRECRGRRLGQSGRRRHADGHAAAVQRLRQPGRGRLVGLAHGDVRARSRDVPVPASPTTSSPRTPPTATSRSCAPRGELSAPFRRSGAFATPAAIRACGRSS